MQCMMAVYKVASQVLASLGYMSDLAEDQVHQAIDLSILSLLPSDLGRLVDIGRLSIIYKFVGWRLYVCPRADIIPAC